MAALRSKQRRRSQDKPKAPLSRLSLYERSLQQRARKEQRIRELREKIMEECTFTPNTTKSNSSSRTSTTRASSGGESVFDRLYRSGSSYEDSTPIASNQRISSRFSASPTGRSAISRTSTAASTRVEELYAAGVRKVRARPKSDQAEKEQRDKRREVRELRECTFRPKLHWGRKCAALQKRKKPSVQHRLEPNMIARPGKPAMRQRKAALPLEIIIKKDASLLQRPWQSPMRQHDPEMELMLVSPLHDPSTIATEDDIIELSTSRQALASPSVENGSLAMTEGNETEYGSI